VEQVIDDASSVELILMVLNREMELYSDEHFQLNLSERCFDRGNALSFNRLSFKRKEETGRKHMLFEECL